MTPGDLPGPSPEVPSFLPAAPRCPFWVVGAPACTCPFCSEAPMTITESLRHVAGLLDEMPAAVALSVEPGPRPRVQLSASGAWRPYIPTGEPVVVDVAQSLHVRWRRGWAAFVVLLDLRDVRALDGLDMVDACGRRLVVGESAALVVCDGEAE